MGDVNSFHLKLMNVLLGTIIKALEDWQEDHGKKDETVQELINKLDAMSMNW